MKKILISGLGLILVLCIAFSASGCGMFKSDEGKIQERIYTVADSYNTGNVAKLIECFDSKTKNTVESALGVSNSILSGITGFDISTKDVLGIVAGMASMSLGDSIKINSVSDIKINGDTATAKVSLTFINVLSDKKETSSAEVKVELVKENDDWFVKSISGL